MQNKIKENKINNLSDILKKKEIKIIKEPFVMIKLNF